MIRFDVLINDKDKNKINRYSSNVLFNISGSNLFPDPLFVIFKILILKFRLERVNPFSVIVLSFIQLF